MVRDGTAVSHPVIHEWSRMVEACSSLLPQGFDSITAKRKDYTNQHAAPGTGAASAS
jgi:hypothetical protein